MSQLNTSRIQNQDTSANGASLKISPMNNTGSIVLETVLANQNAVTIKGNPTTAEVVVDGLVTCLAGISVGKNIIHNSVPTSANHLCNKAYVDSLIVDRLRNELALVEYSGTSTQRVSVNGANIAMIFGSYDDRWQGNRQMLVANLYTNGSTLIQVIQLSNVNEGGNTNNCNQLFKIMWAITIPSNCGFIDFVCTTREGLRILQHIKR